MAVALLALVLATAGTGVAASRYLISSTRQIKPAVISSLSRVALQEQFVVESRPIEVPKGAFATESAPCPLGTHLLSGGYTFSASSVLEPRFSNAQPDGAFIARDAPSFPPPQWFVAVDNMGGTHTVSFRAEALCVRPGASP